MTTRDEMSLMDDDIDTDRARTYVMVAGAWLGGWAWDPVASRLRRAGHVVHTPTLPGMGDRIDEDHPGMDVGVHVADLTTFLTDHDLDEVVLVGHSYAGAVVTGAAARVPERIVRLVHVDASVPQHDGPLLDGAPEIEAAMRAMAEAFDGRRLPLLDDAMLTSPELYGADDLTAEQLQTFRTRATPFPLACMTSPLPAGTTVGAAGIPRSFVRCTRSGPSPWWSDPDARRPDDTYDELSAGHWPMWSVPDALAGLLRLAPRGPGRRLMTP